MRITVESTEELIEIVFDNGAVLPGRVWEGETERGVKVQCLITRIAAIPQGPEDMALFTTELEEQKPPGQIPRAFSPRLIL